MCGIISPPVRYKVPTRLSGKVGSAVGAWGGAYRDEVGVSLVERRQDVGGETQAVGSHVSLDQIAEAGFVDRKRPPFELTNAFGVDVDAKDFVTELREARSGDQAYVSNPKSN
jgi:hypothetical protein